MYRKAINHLVLVCICTSLLGASGALAQTTPPSQTPNPSVGVQSAHNPDSGGEAQVWDETGQRMSLTTTPALSPAFDLGEPGTSFRYVETFGVAEEPYPADGEHLNSPNGLFIDDEDNLYVVEELGFRILKYDSSGYNQLIVGHAGLPWHHDDFLSFPKDVAVSSDGHIWVVIDPAIKEFDADGNLVQIFPETDPWTGGTDNDRFNGPRGIAFDSTGMLYVADTENHRIQIYDVSGGNPVYEATIGETGVAHADNNGFDRPRQIDFDSSDRLYVSDTHNQRIQRCELSGTWSCSTFFGETGVPGNDLDHLEWPTGIDVTSSDEIFITDGGNFRVLVCDTAGVCSHYAGVNDEVGDDNLHFSWPASVEVDSSGNVFVSDMDNHRVQKLDNTGNYLTTIGEIKVPYLTDDIRLNTPWGIGLAPDGSLYVNENRGQRLVKLNADGNQVWSVGQAGISGDDNEHLNWPSGNIGVDDDGLVYFPDTWNHRIQIYDSDGNYIDTFGSYGDGIYEFDGPIGVTINPLNGDIIVTDTFNHRIQVYTASRIHKATLGILDEPGDDNQHFNYPHGVGVDADGAIYVADRDNFRVQKCTLNGSDYTCTTFTGETGVFDNAFGHVNPLSVVIDQEGRVYVADEWNNRVQVYDTDGAYLTTIGGSWGANTGETRGPLGVAVDGEGILYIADPYNHRIQKFAPDYPGWVQTNINGFGEPGVTVSSLEVFKGNLYGGTWGKGQVWRSPDGRDWSQLTPAWTEDNWVSDMLVYKDHLYVATYGEFGAEIWRNDGNTWGRVVEGGFGDINNSSVNALAELSGYLYAAAFNPTTGVEVWRSASGDAGSWTQVNTDGFGGANTAQDMVMDVFNGFLYLGLGRDGVAEMWRSQNGTTWSPIITDGLADNNTNVGAMAELNGEFYVGLRNVETGGEVWKSSNGLDWTRVFNAGLGNPDNGRPYGLIVYAGELYLVFSNLATGGEVWRSSDGATWEPVMQDGWGDSNNDYVDYFDKAAVVFKNRLYLGTLNDNNGGEVWKLNNLLRIFLPAAVR